MILTDPTRTTLLLHAAEANGSTTPADSSAYGHTLTAVGNAQVSSDHALFGHNMLKFDGSGDAFSIAASSDFDPGSGDFTIDFTTWVVSYTTTREFFGRRANDSSYGPFMMRLNTSGKLVLFMSTTGTSWAVNATGTATIPTGQLVHLRLVRSGTSVKVYVDGTVDISATVSGALHNPSVALVIGAGSSAYGYSLNGYIGEFRFLKGEAANTGNFTPPSEAYSLGYTLTCPGFTLAGSLSASPGLLVEAAGFELTGSLDAALFLGIVVDAAPFTLSGSLAGEVTMGVTAPGFTLTGSLAGSLAMVAGCPGFAAGAALSAGVSLLDYPNPALLFTCTLTGAPDGLDDLALPLSSFQALHRASAASYLSVVVPGIELADDIADRPNGEIVLTMAKANQGVVFHSEEILRVALGDVREDKGGRNRSITISGYGATTNADPKTVALRNPTYRSADGSETRYRLAEPDIFLRPGDTATCGADSFTVESIGYTVSVGQMSCEVAS